jgi:hypothetical protein
VDRRWFEEALRSQGFVVEPPDEDVETEPDAGPGPAPETSGSDAPADPSEIERPPVPSALLARIAARGQPAPVAEPEPRPALEAVAATEPETVAATEPETVAAPEPDRLREPERPTPWATAIPAPVAPWASTGSTAAIQTSEPGPGNDDAPAAVEVQEVAEPERAEPGPAGPGPAEAAPDPSLAPPSIEATPPLAPAPAAGRLRAPWVASAGQAPEVTHEPPVPVPSAILDSPYEPAAVTAASVAPARPAAAPVAPAPEAAEGELWALVGASEPTARPVPASEATRVILTILTAFLIIVILVGSLVLASQIV